MADEEVKETEGTEQEAPKGGSKTLMLIIIGVVMLLVAVALVVFVIFPKYQQLTGTGDDTEVVEEESAEGPTQIGQVFTIDNLTINPKGSMGRRFAVFEIVLEFERPELSSTLSTLKPIIMDHYLTFLRTKTVVELSRPAEMDSIRSNLKKIVNGLLNSDEITNLYFTRFVLE